MITILKDNEILDIGLHHSVSGPYSFARAIEQAVLQSPEMQQMRKDADAFQTMCNHRLTVCVREHGGDVEVFRDGEALAWPATDPEKNGADIPAVAHEAIRIAVQKIEGDAAMEKQP